MPVWGEIVTRELRARIPRKYPPEMIDRLARERILTMVE
jgi:hypothetical protein